jgi:hypothetical protein
MKKFILPFCAAATLLGSCDTSFTTPVSERKTMDTAIHSMPTISGKHCYTYTGINDSIFITVNIDDKKASGNLVYKLSGKDKNEGNFEGTMSVDTLFATYHFSSEGVLSDREIAFILSDSKAVEAYGAMTETNGVSRFKDRNRLSVEHNFTLSKENCKQH